MGSAERVGARLQLTGGGRIGYTLSQARDGTNAFVIRSPRRSGLVKRPELDRVA